MAEDQWFGECLGIHLLPRGKNKIKSNNNKNNNNDFKRK